jgi:predicted homoserine dehydrogenase-like protein
VWGRVAPAAESVRARALPIGLARGLRLARPVARGAVVGWADVDAPPEDDVLAVRRELETVFPSDRRTQ